jgi:hypothetical protein
MLKAKENIIKKVKEGITKDELIKRYKKFLEFGLS